MGLEQSDDISEAYTHQNICQKHLRESRGSKQSFEEGGFAYQFTDKY